MSGSDRLTIGCGHKCTHGILAFLWSHITHLWKQRPSQSGMRFKADNLVGLQDGSFIGRCVTFIPIMICQSAWINYISHKNDWCLLKWACAYFDHESQVRSFHIGMTSVNGSPCCGLVWNLGEFINNDLIIGCRLYLERAMVPSGFSYVAMRKIWAPVWCCTSSMSPA